MIKRTITILKEIIDKYGREIFYQSEKYSQFTIDIMDKFKEHVKNKELDENSKLVQKLIHSLIYDTENILEIIKEGNDKDFFNEFHEEIYKLKV